MFGYLIDVQISHASFATVILYAGALIDLNTMAQPVLPVAGYFDTKDRSHAQRKEFSLPISATGGK